MLPARAAVNGKQQSPQPGRLQVPAGRGHFLPRAVPKGGDGGKEAATMACETHRLAAFCVPGRKAAGRAVRVPSRDFRKQQKRRGSLFPWNLFFGALEGTRTPGLLIRR